MRYKESAVSKTFARVFPFKLTDHSPVEEQVIRITEIYATVTSTYNSNFLSITANDGMA
jgi:hypothetical protein